MADNAPSRRKPLDLLFCFPSIRPSVISLASFSFPQQEQKTPIRRSRLSLLLVGRGAVRNRLGFGGTAAGFVATILSGGGWPGNSQRKMQTNFVLVEAISTYICSLMFAGPAGGAGHTLGEADSPSATLLEMGVQGRAAAGLQVADTIPQSNRRRRTGQTATRPPWLDSGRVQGWYQAGNLRVLLWVPDTQDCLSGSVSLPFCPSSPTNLRVYLGG